MNQFCKNLVTEWRRLGLPFEDGTFVIAVSGGADSVSLALALQELRERRKLRLRFVVAHFNHSLRGKESGADQEFVKSVAAKHGFELALGEGHIPPQGNLEQNARRARYQFLYETAANLHAIGIVTAHTLNDQAETFLMNLIRGSGLEGLGGMKTVRVLEGKMDIPEEFQKEKSKIPSPKPEILLVRPMLRWAGREMTEKYCLERGVEYRYDTMNEDLAFQRVRIRKVLLPLLEDLNPKITENLARTAFLLQDDYAALEAVAKPAIEQLRVRAGRRRPKLPLKELRKLSPSIRRKAVRDWLRDEKGDLRRIESAHIEAIDALIFSRKSGTVIELPNHEIVRKEDGMIVFMENEG